MSSTDWEMVLAETLKDWKLSRGEKAVFQHLLAEHRKDPHQLAVIRSIAFRLARESMVDPSVKTVLPWLEEVVKALEYRPGEKGTETNEAWFSPDPDCVNRIERLFRAAREKVEVCVFTITDDRLTEAILDAHKRNIRIRIITDNDKAFDPGSDIQRMQKAGVAVKTDAVSDHMHHKYALFDREILLTGSYNWTRAAARANDDNFIVTDNVSLVRNFCKHFDRLWDQLEMRS